MDVVGLDPSCLVVVDLEGQDRGHLVVDEA